MLKVQNIYTFLQQPLNLCQNFILREHWFNIFEKINIFFCIWINKIVKCTINIPIVIFRNYLYNALGIVVLGETSIVPVPF